jgi:imidazolonepropionase-like amidohydrolase
MSHFRRALLAVCLLSCAARAQDPAPSAALLSGTRDAARLLGVDAETGSLEAGKFADIVAVPGNVLEDIRATEHPTFVMKQGRVVVGGP